MRIRIRDVRRENAVAAAGYSGTPSLSGDRVEREPARVGGAPLWELGEGDLVLVKEPGREATVATIEDTTVPRDVLWLRFHNGTGRRLIHCGDEVLVFKQFVP